HNQMRDIYLPPIEVRPEAGGPTGGSNIRISGNDVYDSLSWHQRFWEQGEFGLISAYGADDLEISGNLLASVIQATIHIEDSSQVLIDHNTLFPGSETGIEFWRAASDVTIARNHFPFMPFAAIRFHRMETAAGALVIDSNTFHESMINFPTDLDIVHVAAVDGDATWSSVQATNNIWTQPNIGHIDLFMEIHHPGTVVSGNNPSTGIWIGP